MMQPPKVFLCVGSAEVSGLTELLEGGFTPSALVSAEPDNVSRKLQDAAVSGLGV